MASHKNSDESTKSALAKTSKGKEVATVDHDDHGENPKENQSFSATESESEPITSKYNKRKEVSADENNGDNLRKNDKASTSEKVPTIIHKIWTDEDEFTLLKAAVGYTEDKRLEPNLNITDFHSYADKSLNGMFSKTQVGDKLRRLKRKYLNNATKAKSISIPVEKSLFDLSEKIWGNSSGNISDSTSEFVSRYSNNIMSEFLKGSGLAKEDIPAVVNENNKEMEKRWRKVVIDELELLITKYDAANKELMIMLEALKSSTKN